MVKFDSSPHLRTPLVNTHELSLLIDQTYPPWQIPSFSYTFAPIQGVPWPSSAIVYQRLLEDPMPY